MKRSLNFIKTAGTYLVGTVLSKLVSFLMLPLYTNYLDPSVMGEYDFVTTIISFLAPVCFFQIWDAMFRFAFESEEMEYKRRIVNDAYVVELFGIILYMLLFVIINNYTKFTYSKLSLMYGLAVAWNYLYAYIARVYLDNVLYVVSGFLNSLITIGMNIFLIACMGLGLEAMLVSSIVGLLAQCIIIEIRIKPIKYLNIRLFDKETVRRMIKFSMPLCIATISYWLLSGYTKVIIVNKLGAYENGLYSVANKIALILNVAVSVFQYAWNETAYLSSNDSDRFSMYTKATKYIIQFAMIFSVVLMVIANALFPVFIGNEYLGATKYLPLSIIAVAFNSVAGFSGTIISTEKETKYILGTTIIAAIVNCILAIVFTDKYGLTGSLLALSIAFCILMIARTTIMKIFIGINVKLVDYWPIVFLVIGSIACTFCNTALQIVTALISIGFMCAINRKELLIIIKRKL